MEHVDMVGESGATRRSVLRMAGHTAWAAPVIALASAAPAYAVGSPTGTIAVSQATFTTGILGVLPWTLTATAKNISNTDTFGTANDGVSILSPVSITFTLGLGISVLPSVTGTGWTLTSSLLDLANLGIVTVTWTGGTLAPGASTSQVTLSWLVGISLTGGRVATPSAQDTFGHNANQVSKTF